MSDWERAVQARRCTLQGELEALDVREADLREELSSVLARQDEVRGELEVLDRLKMSAPPSPVVPAEPATTGEPQTGGGVDYTVIRNRILQRFLVPEHGRFLPTGPGKKVYFHTPDWNLAVHILLSAAHTKSGRPCGWFGVNVATFDAMRRRARSYDLVYAVQGIERIYRVPSDLLRPFFLQSNISRGVHWHMNLYLDTEELYVPQAGVLSLSTCRIEAPELWKVEQR